MLSFNKYFLIFRSCNRRTVLKPPLSNEHASYIEKSELGLPPKNVGEATRKL
jgi:hypothetical protein